MTTTKAREIAGALINVHQTGIAYGASDVIFTLSDLAEELLEALQAMVDTYEYEASAQNPALLQARAVIAKAA